MYRRIDTGTIEFRASIVIGKNQRNLLYLL
jgi:hypothetical protein